jgi:WD40 repeat protein
MKAAVLDPANLESNLAPVPLSRDGVKYHLQLGSVSSDGRFQGVWAVDEQVMEIWDRLSAKRLCSLPSHFDMLSFDSRRQLIATVTTNSSSAYCTKVWQLPSGTPKWVLTDGSPARHFFTGDGEHLLTRDETHLYMWRIEGETLKLSGMIRGVFYDPVVSSDGRLLASFYWGDIMIWELPSAKVVGVLKGHTRKMARLTFSPDRRTLASISDDRTIRLWHIATQRELLQFQAPNEDRGLFWLEFSPDGRALAASRVDDDGAVCWLYYAPSLAEVAVTEGGDYRAEAGDDPIVWLAVAKSLVRKKRWHEAKDAFDEVLNLTANREDFAWLRTNALRQRAEVLNR